MAKQNEIMGYIKSEYIDGQKLLSSKDIVHDLDLLVENKLACKIAGTKDLLSQWFSDFYVACYFISKYDKKHFKKYRYDTSRLKYVNDKYIDRVELTIEKELGKYMLSPGTYVVNVKDDSYIYMVVSISPHDYYEMDYTMYLIGYEYDKLKDKFFKLCDEWESKCKKEMKEKSKLSWIEYSDDRDVRAQFKTFDKMVFKDKDKILKYIDTWIDNIPTYYKYGMTPKLSILLHGKPGTGKSTFYKALSKYLGLNGVKSLPPDFFMLVDNEYTKSRGQVHQNFAYSSKLISIDEIDCICNNREEDDSSDNSMVLSNLLKFLDNPPTFYYKAKDGVHYPISVVVATTNYYDRLDKAIKRHGRFDLTIKMEYLDREEAEELCSLFDLKLSDVVKNIPKNFSMSAAELEARCCENIDKRLKNPELNKQ